jgi:hypothetical protein
VTDRSSNPTVHDDVETRVSGVFAGKPHGFSLKRPVCGLAFPGWRAASFRCVVNRPAACAAEFSDSVDNAPGVVFPVASGTVLALHDGYSPACKDRNLTIRFSALHFYSVLTLKQFQQLCRLFLVKKFEFSFTNRVMQDGNSDARE